MATVVILVKVRREKGWRRGSNELVLARWGGDKKVSGNRVGVAVRDCDETGVEKGTGEEIRENLWEGIRCGMVREGQTGSVLLPDGFGFA